jgi:Rrf2 family iron-sulfur cluster assembly transcriptional regulator
VRLTKGADYGARGTIHLAKRPAGAVVLISEIAAAEGLPESYLAKIFQDLAKEGIVRSHRGARGGFSLARPPDEITLREVVEAIDGPIAINRCLAPWEGCDRAETCAMYPVMQEAQRLLLDAFASTTLFDLALREGFLST